MSMKFKVGDRLVLKDKEVPLYHTDESFGTTIDMYDFINSRDVFVISRLKGVYANILAFEDDRGECSYHPEDFRLASKVLLNSEKI